LYQEEGPDPRPLSQDRDALDQPDLPLHPRRDLAGGHSYEYFDPPLWSNYLAIAAGLFILTVIAFQPGNQWIEAMVCLFLLAYGLSGLGLPR
jgi:hypothetical protein